MFMKSVYDPSRWTQQESETMLEYWASFTPMAPMFGVEWRFATALISAFDVPAAPAKDAIRKAPKKKAVAPRKAPAAAKKVVAPTPQKAAPPVVAKTEAPRAAPAPKAPAPSDAATASKAKTPAAPKAKAPAAKPDDLTLIKGVGPKLAGNLHSAGITQFAQIAEWKPADIKAIEEKLGGLPGRIVRDNWVGQAKELNV